MTFEYANKPVINAECSIPRSRQTALRSSIRGTVLHSNYLEYLSDCYARHCSIVVKPDYLWYTILCELAVIVKENAEKYRHVFTDSQAKKEIVIPTDDPIQIDEAELMRQVMAAVPSTIVKEDVLLPFSTATPESTFAFTVAFLDAMSPYYNYSMYLCGYNRIDVRGTRKDYGMILAAVLRLQEKIAGEEVKEYMERCYLLLSRLIDGFDHTEFWKEIFSPQICGSGHQEEVKGWFTDLFYKIPKVAYVRNFSTHVSILKYKELVTQKKYIMRCGLLSSAEQDGFLVPNFEYYINRDDLAPSQDGKSEACLSIPQPGDVKVIKSGISNVELHIQTVKIGDGTSGFVFTKP